MGGIRRVRCPQCGAVLRRGRRPGLCGPCELVGSDPRCRLPADFYDRDVVVALLGSYDFGRFFLLLRRLTGWSQVTLGGVIGLEQSRISAVERGESQLRDVELVAGVSHAVGIPPVLLNFPGIGATVSAAGAGVGKVVSWVQRRDFGQHVATLVLGVAAAAGLDIDRLMALLPQAEPAGVRRVGVADVEAVEQVTTAFVRQDFAYGSGGLHAVAAASLRAMLPLLKAQVATELRPRLMVATGRLAMQAGWMSFDCARHDAARRLWMIGLDLARRAQHPLSTDLTVYLLYDMAVQAVHLDRPQEALHLIRIGETAAVGRHPVSVSTLCSLTSIEARAAAANGDAAGCDRALGHAEEHFAAIDPATAPPWGGHVSEAGMSGFHGVAHYTLALPSRDPRAASRAIPLLRDAMNQFGPAYARLRGLYLPDLVGAYALAGDLDTAITLGHQAIDAVSAVSSPRAHDRLRTLDTVLAPLHTNPGVTELRDRLTTTAA